MSAIAGRVLILPKGDYDASVTYEFLDLVNHNSSSWLAKKASTGIEPSDENAEFWQKFGSSFTVDGETITIDENGVISAVGGTADKVTYENELVEDVTNVKEALDNIYSDYAEKSDLANYLPLSGGTIIGNTHYPLSLQANSGVGSCIMPFYNGDSILGSIGFLGVDDLVYTPSSGSGAKQILHTGNKPSGSYTGNGDATTRTIDTKGLGSVVAITVTGSTVIVLYGGAIIISNGTVSGLSASEANFCNGVLTLATTNGSLNTSGTTYYWQVL